MMLKKLQTTSKTLIIFLLSIPFSSAEILNPDSAISPIGLIALSGFNISALEKGMERRKIIKVLDVVCSFFNII